jgi:hypothetical protein
MEIEVHKNFAIYHYDYLLKLVEPKRCKEVLKKSVEFYKSTLTKIISHL